MNHQNDDLFKGVWGEMGIRGKLYFASFLAWIFLFVIPGYREANRQYDEGRKKVILENNIPTLTPEQMKQRIADLKKRASNVSSDPRDYWKILDERRELEDLYSASAGVIAHHRDYGTAMWQLGAGLINPVRQAYWDRHSQQVMYNIAQEENAKRDNLKPRSIPNIPGFPFGWMFWAWYASSLWFAGFVFLLRINACRLSIFLELVGQPWRFVLAVIAWPVGIFMYPNDDAKQQLTASIRLATGLLSTALSFAGGSVMASGKQDTSSKKSRKPWSLQLDARTNWFVPGEGPVPVVEESLRITANAPNRLLLESVNVRKDKTWINWSVVGWSFIRNSSVRVNVYAGGVFTSSGSHSPQYGLQCYYSNRRFSIATPVLGMEHQVRPKRSDSFVLTTLPGFWFGKRHLGGELNVRALPNKPLQWSVGPRIGMKVGRASFIEAGALLNQQNDWRLRFRLVHNVLPRAQ